MAVRFGYRFGLIYVDFDTLERIPKLSAQWFREELESRIGFRLAEPMPFKFDRQGDAFGWNRQVFPNGQTYLRKNDRGEVVGVDMPKFFEVNINLLRSVITRRRAAQVQKYDALWPYFKYEPRDQTQVGKLRADMVSQRMDIMADQYGYRHFNSQAILHMLLYSKCVAFPRAYWEREVQLEREPGVPS